MKHKIQGNFFFSYQIIEHRQIIHCQITRFFSLTLKPLLDLSPITIPSYLPLLLCHQLHEPHKAAKLPTPCAPVLSCSVILLMYSFCLKYPFSHFKYPILHLYQMPPSLRSLCDHPRKNRSPVTPQPAVEVARTSLHVGSDKSSNRQTALRVRGGNNFQRLSTLTRILLSSH